MILTYPRPNTFRLLEAYVGYFYLGECTESVKGFRIFFIFNYYIIYTSLQSIFPLLFYKNIKTGYYNKTGNYQKEVHDKDQHYESISCVACKKISLAFFKD